MGKHDEGDGAVKATKPKQTRNISKKRLYKALEGFCTTNNISQDEPVRVVLEAIKEAGFREYLAS